MMSKDDDDDDEGGRAGGGRPRSSASPSSSTVRVVVGWGDPRGRGRGKPRRFSIRGDDRCGSSLFAVRPAVQRVSALSKMNVHGHPQRLVQPEERKRQQRRRRLRRTVAAVVVAVAVFGMGGPVNYSAKNDGRNASGSGVAASGVVARSMAAAADVAMGGVNGVFFFFYGDGRGGGGGGGSASSLSSFSSPTPSTTMTFWGAHRLTRQPEKEEGRWDPDLGGDVGNADAVRQIPLVPPDSKATIGVPDHPNATTSCPTTSTTHASCRDVRFVGFVRITKTASTTMLSFLNGLAPRQLLTYDHFLNFPMFFRDVARNDIRSTRGIVPACVFGGAAATTTETTTDGRMGGARIVGPNNPSHNATGATMLPPYAWQCPHTTYRGVVATWARGLPYLREDSQEETPTTTKTMSASLQVFTVVREPTERFVSYFHYWRRIYPHWKELATPDEHRAMVNGDLAGFLELQSSQQSSLTINSAFQYRYLSDDVDEAIAMVRESPVRVLVLLNECFEASLRMLASILPHLVQDEDVDEFLRSASNQKYTQGNASIPIVLRATSEIRPVQPVPMDDIRNMSRTWLRDDYSFYRASVDQFRRILETSNVDPGLIQECYRRLDSS